MTCLLLDSKSPKTLHLKALFAFCLILFNQIWRLGRHVSLVH